MYGLDDVELLLLFVVKSAIGVGGLLLEVDDEDGSVPFPLLESDTWEEPSSTEEGGEREKMEGNTLEKEEKKPEPERLDSNEERRGLLLSGVESLEDEW